MITYGKTDAGQLRPMNQDYHWESVSPVGSFPNLFIIADGMGGHNAGDFASRFAAVSYTHLDVYKRQRDIFLSAVSGIHSH